jgi:putative ABC transport system permease protein
VRFYRWLLRWCAPSLRAEYGTAMEETLSRRLADARVAGPWSMAKVWVRELGSVMSLAVSERGGLRIGQEFRYGIRRLARTPSFSVAALLTLALAIGANASIFTVVHRVVLNPLPYPDSGRLIELDHGSIGLKMPAGLGLTAGLYFYYRDHAPSLESAAIHATRAATVTGDGEPDRIRVTSATPSLARVLRVPPAVGRWFSDEEGEPGAPVVTVLSHGLWIRRYGGVLDVLGRSMILDGVRTEIVGVMPATFAFPDPRIDAWTVAQIRAADGFGLWDYEGVARLRERVTVEGARAELQGLIPAVPAAYPHDPRAAGNVEAQLTFTGRPLKESIVGSVERALWMLLASVGVVMLVACVNVGNLFLVRADGRLRETAIRRALGAGRLAIVRTFLAESLLLALGGGVLGLIIAMGAVRLVVALAPAGLPRLEEIRVDGVIVLFTFVLATTAALIFGVMPLRRRADLVPVLQETGRGNMVSPGRQRARYLLLGAQVAMALVLLVASGLLMRSLQKLRAVDPGFDPASALTFSLGLPERDYPTREAAVDFHHRILEQLASLPGVTSVAAATCLPLSGGCSGNTLLVQGRTYPAGTIPPLVLFRAVSAGYFETMGIRVQRGRSITRDDVIHREPVVVVDETLALSFFAGQDPIGQRVASNRPPARPGAAPGLIWLTIVGVVARTPLRTPGESTHVPSLYMPMSIAGGPGPLRTALIGPDVSFMKFVVRSATPPLDQVPAVRRAIGTIDGSIALYQARTLQAMLDQASAQMAFTMVLLAIAAGVALVLGVIGTHGVMSYIVRLRTLEIGVRLALGAVPASVARRILRQGGLVATGGIVVGLAASAAGGQLIESLLYGVSPRDPAIFAGTATLLLGVALLACWIPARRAARLNPIDVLRS